VLGTAGGAAANGQRERGRAMGAALEKLSQGGSLASVTDPVEWQREVRRDRELAGRPTAPPQTPDAP